MVSAYAERHRRDWEARVSAAWHGEVFQREKRLKPLKHYLKAKDAEAPQPPKALYASVKHAMLGAKDVIRKPVRKVRRKG